MDRRRFLALGAGCPLLASFLQSCAPATEPPAVLDEPDALARLDALGQAQLFKDGEVSATDLVESAIRRVESTRGALNCVVHEAFDHARSAAASATPEDGPFAGVPYLLKCLEAREGMPHTLASRFFADQIAEESDPVTVAAEAAGLIYLGNSSSPEFGLIASTSPSLYGPCNNPWDLERSPAGSSGGSAALVAAGVVPIATADDGGGSIRLPASSCGTVGLKCSRGREVGHEEQFLVNTGCESRSVRDTAAFVHAVENPEHSELPPIGSVRGPSSQRLRVAFTATGNDASVEPDAEVADRVAETAALLEELGHEVSERRFEVDGALMREQFMVVWCSGAAQTVASAREALGREPDEREFEPWTLGLARESETHPAEAIPAAMAYFADLRARYEAFCSEIDVVLTPVTTTPAQKTTVQDPRRSDYDALRAEVWAWVNYTPLHNLVGAPSLSLPLHTSSDGLPIGMLFSGGWGTEARLLELAYELEQARPWAGRWPAHGVV